MLGVSGVYNWTVFTAYIVFGVSHGMLVTWTQNEEKGYSYNATAAVLHTEVLKLVMVFLLARRSKSLSTLMQDVSKNIKVLMLYFIPAFLYAVYNSLSFLNLTYFDPLSYFVLMQLRVVLSGVIYQVLFRKELSARQWFSLVLLAIGCMIKHVDSGALISAVDDSLDGEQSEGRVSRWLPSYRILLILLQLFCSTFAGVFTELLLKRYAIKLDMWTHNIFMYVDSIVCGLFLFAASNQPVAKLLFLLDVGGDMAWQQQLKVAVVVVNMAAMGISTAVFLKSLNSIVKNFANGLELVITALLTWLLFGIPITKCTVVAMVLILTAIHLYSTNPVKQTPIPLVKRKAKLSESADSANGDYRLEREPHMSTSS
ncbi:UDP-galactose transporter senju-like [Diadema setosum]|uniref:UDP-galactose transporter senju-like n=1 Tax=Diadema setosum TaxID=31175 RepID=UPI003B3BDEE0